jgi:uncharacterized Tic20 family protein
MSEIYYSSNEPGAPVPRRPDERRWAAIAHLSVVLPVVGPLLVYLLQRREIPWAGLHALQALAYCLAVIVLEIGIFLASLVLGAILAVATDGQPQTGVLCALPLLLAVLAFGYAAYAAHMCYHKHSFRYPVIGDLIDGL